MISVANHWNTFEDTIVPKNAGRSQREMMKLSFYAGYLSCLMAGIDIADKYGDDSESGGAEIGNLQQECMEYLVRFIGAPTLN